MWIYTLKGKVVKMATLPPRGIKREKGRSAHFSQSDRSAAMLKSCGREEEGGGAFSVVLRSRWGRAGKGSIWKRASWGSRYRRLIAVKI